MCSSLSNCVAKGLPQDFQCSLKYNRWKQKQLQTERLPTFSDYQGLKEREMGFKELTAGSTYLMVNLPLFGTSLGQDTAQGVSFLLPYALWPPFPLLFKSGEVHGGADPTPIYLLCTWLTLGWQPLGPIK